MRQNYDEAIRLLLISEGGNDDDPQDPGGRTSRGILQREWNIWRQTHPGLPEDVWAAPQDQVIAIYKQNYWDKLHCDDLPSGVDYAVFDYGVNSGIVRAAKVLQNFVGVEQDGVIGPLTIAAANKVDPKQLIKDICDQRLIFLQGLNTWARFGRGWSNRVKSVKEVSLQMANRIPTVVLPVVKEQSWWERFKSFFTGKKPDVVVPLVTTEPVWVIWALKEVGFHETGNNRNISRYTSLAKCGQEGDPWCAIFVNAALEVNGIPGTRSALARSFEHDANFVQLSGPAYGAVVTMWRGSPKSGSGHVFFYLGENDKGVLALGGNQSDQVCKQYEPRARIVGYFWPKSIAMPIVGPIIIKNSQATDGSET